MDILTEPPRPPEEDKGHGKSVSQILIEIGLKATLFHDERGDGYALVEDGQDAGGRYIFPISGKDFKHWLRRQYYKQTKRAPHDQALAEAIQQLEAQAKFEGETKKLHVRFAQIGDEIWLDLADRTGRAIRVSDDGWSIVDQPPILFRRFPHQEALPQPEGGGSIETLWSFLNLADQDDALLVVSWLIAGMIPAIPRPILCLHGPQGSAKTTAALMLKALLDPSVAGALDLGRDYGELVQMLDHHAIPVLDNLSKIQTWQADLLCRAVTGGASVKRELYSNADDILMKFKCAIIMTGINIPTAAPDFLDRSLLVGLERVLPEKRREEVALWEEFEVARPKILGSLLDVLVKAMRIRPSLLLPRLPRMADFGRWGAAVALALGYSRQHFLDAIQRNSHHQVEEVLDSDPIADAVRQFTFSRQLWTGTATELLKELESAHGGNTPGNGWPKQANRLSHRLKVLKTPLAEVGVEIVFLPGRGQGRRLTLRAVGVGKEPSSPSSSSSLAPDKAYSEDDAFQKVAHRALASEVPSLDNRSTVEVQDGQDAQDDTVPVLAGGVGPCRGGAGDGWEEGDL